MPPAPPVAAVRAAVRAALAPHPRVLLAVSGGPDSMVLLDAASAAAPDHVAGVATFDHGTGAHAARAVTLVRAACEARGIPVIAGRAAGLAPTEAAWREARWRFLRDSAAELGAAVVATGHTRDDQIETVALRILRGAGARGLAGLAAPSAGIVRPLLSLGRGEIAAYVAARRLPTVDDPGNRSPRWQRNRLRHELLPALERVSPGLAADLLRLGAEAAAWRAEVEAFVARSVAVNAAEDGSLRVALASLRGYDAESLAVVWPAIAARAGVRLDRRGTRRVVQFTMRRAAEAATGASMQLAGGAEVVARRGELLLRPASAMVPGAGRTLPATTPVPDGERELVGEVRLGRWIFRPTTAVGSGEPGWEMELPVGDGAPAIVRPWRAGDRMPWRGGGSARRVKRFLADAGIPGRERTGWPVVLVDGEIVWIPGVRRSDAATVRQGAPGICYVCERIRD